MRRKGGESCIFHFSTRCVLAAYYHSLLVTFLIFCRLDLNPGVTFVHGKRTQVGHHQSTLMSSAPNQQQVLHELIHLQPNSLPLKKVQLTCINRHIPLAAVVSQPLFQLWAYLRQHQDYPLNVLLTFLLGHRSELHS